MPRQAWNGSTRRSRLPANWTGLRRTILERDPVCRLRYDCCTLKSTDVDHVRPGDDHRLGNLQGVCNPCHLRKTATERPRAARATESHPGLL